MVIVSCLSIVTLGSFWISYEYSNFSLESKKLRDQYVDEQKKLIQDEVQRTLNYINFKRAANKSNEKIVQQEILDWINKIRFGKNGYIFVYSFDATTLAHYKPGNIGINQWNFSDPNGVKVLQELIQLSKNEKGGFLEYIGTIRPTTGLPARKISYAKSVLDWEWMIGAGVYIDDIEITLTKKQSLLNKKIQSHIVKISFVLLFSVLVILIISKLISNRIMTGVEAFLSFFKKAATESIKIPSEDIHFLEFKNLINSANHMVDQRMQAENSLRESEKRFQHLSNASTEAIFFTKDGIGIEANQAATEMFGYSLSELIGMFGTELIAPESHEIVKEHMLKNLSDPYEAIGLRKDGSQFPIEIQGKSITYKDKGLVRATTIVDITERKQAEEALQESEEKYRSMMESMVEAAYICSPDFQIEFMNAAMIKKIGHYADIEPCYKTIYGINEQCAWCDSKNVMNGESTSYELVSPSDDKTYHISSSPIFHTDGSISKLTVFRDITKLKTMEASLQQSQKMESIGTLAGGIAHDFNNILFPILGHTEMLLADAPEDNSTQKALNKIHAGTLRASELVKQILTFSRQNTNELKPIKIQPIIEEALKLIRSSIPATIKIKQNIQPDCGILNADPTQIHQIIMNLSTNAYHAMEDTGGELRISLKEIELGALDLLDSDMAPGTYAYLSISDTGKGMNKELIQKIFDPFFTTKKEGKGTGMGLSVVHGIVTNM
ncbi:MAG: PAS domain S-box protein, partial [Desulfobacteraceae bacterium]|nr:PAS domain S-box protein [Desulfobacteraceae bacterium]